MTKRILVVDDDLQLREFLDDYLKAHGFEVSTADNGDSMGEILANETIDMVLLDLMLPNENGFDLARRIRTESMIPIIMLTGRNDEMDRVVGLEIGADDYVSKPFSARELLARINAVLRRVSEGPAESTEPDDRKKIAVFSGWHMDFATRRLFSPAGEEVKLTAGQFALLSAFVRSRERVLSREQLLDFTQGEASEAWDRSIDIQVMRLRRKIEPNPSQPALIQTVRGVGYVFSATVNWE